MKINKTLIEKKLREEDTPETTADTASTETVSVNDVIIDDVKSATVADVADAIQDTAVAVDAPPVSDAQAKEMAKEIKTFAKGINAASWAPLDYENALTKKLDMCLAASLMAQKNKTKNRANLLVTGLPGSGKTNIVENWAKARGCVLCPVAASDSDLDFTLNGFAVDDVTKKDDGSNQHDIIRAKSAALNLLEEPRSILFLDEFNRADYGKRGLLLNLVNSHRVIGREFPNMLFTVACINPAVDTDPGATPLLDAEKSRFIQHMTWDSDPDVALKYLRKYLATVLQETDPQDDEYALLYERNAYILQLAIALLGDTRFKFDTKDDLEALADNEENMLNQRLITDLLMAFGYDKHIFLDCIDGSGMLAKNKRMIHDILDNWTPPKIAVPGSTDASAVADAGTAASAAGADPAAGLTGDFSQVFQANGTETDSGLFGTAATAEQRAARVSAEEARRRIRAFSC